jgi:signal peptidase
MLKKFTTVIAIIIGLATAGLLFIHFSPDYGLYFVKSGSMRPSINPGDIVITGPVGDLQPGKIITFEQHDVLVTHRIIGREGDMLQTKGDNNEDPDTSLLPISSVFGSYLFRIPYVGYINSFVSTRKGWFLIIIVPAIVLVLFIVKDIIKETLKSPKTDKEATKGGDAIEVKK